VKKIFHGLLWFAIWLQFDAVNGVAQPSVYSGAYVFGEGGLTTKTDWQAITNFVSSAQKDVSIINNFDSWTDSGSNTNGTQTFPATEMNNIRNHGAIPMFTWQPQNGNQGVTQSFCCSNVANGVYDAYITQWAQAAAAWGHPFFLRFAHEMNGNWYPWCSGVNGNTSAEYIRMWQHVHDIFTSVGTTNVTWVWCVNVPFNGSAAITGLYPGDNYVDWISLDGYNRLANPWQDFSAIAGSTVTQLTSIAPGKPIMVAETGCNQSNNGSKSQWFLNVLTNYLPSQPRIKAWVYFNSTNTTDGNDWRITVPASAVTGYQQGIALACYDTNRYAAISSSPIQPLLNDNTTTDTMPPFVSITSPATDTVTNGTTVTFLALASDKSGISNVVFSINGTAQQTNSSPPYQFSWLVPFPGGITYTVTAVALDNSGNSAVSTVQVVSMDAGLQGIPQTVNESSAGLDWTGAIWGTPAAAAINGGDYETPGGFDLRTPNHLAPAAFPGSSLQIDSGGILYLKHNNGVAMANVILNGGEIEYHGAPGGTNSPLGGSLQVLTNSLITSDQGAATVNIWLQSTLSGSGNLTVAMTTATNALILSGNNAAYSGNWTNTSGFILVGNGTANALGSGLVDLVNAGNLLDFNSTNYLTVNNVITGAGSVWMNNGAGSVTLTASNTYTGSTEITNGVLQLGASGSIASSAVIALQPGGTLDVSAVSGGLVIGSPQTLGGVGNVLGNVAMGGTISPGSSGTLAFANNLALFGMTIIQVNRTNGPNAGRISAAAITFGGTLTVTNIGGMLQAGDSFQLFSGALGGAFAHSNLPALSPASLFWDTSKLYSRGILTVAAQTPASPMILPPLLNGTSLTIQVNAQAGFNYVLQTSTQMAPSNWTAIQTNSGSGLLTFTIPINASAQQFFRISAQ
jgi:autotransporter-associated beta strand protein